MKTPEQIAAETAKQIVQDGLSVRAKNYMASHWPDSINALTDCARDYILAALTEHAKGLEEERDGWRETAERYAKNDIDRQAELTALRAVADEMEGALKEIADYDRGSRHGEGVCPYGCDAPDIAQKALTRYAAQTQAGPDSDMARLDHENSALITQADRLCAEVARLSKVIEINKSDTDHIITSQRENLVQLRARVAELEDKQ